ncbi:MAG: peptidoglycan/xylan/chitin deacetylase (PgdA/CDA1 family), partial [Limisphaerales bacterium]
KIFSSMTWDFGKEDKTLYLTFDDGPTPQVTDFVLSELERVDAKATFFCIGANVIAHPEIMDRIIAAGHSVGNHTFNHVNGWKTDTEDYTSQVAKCAEVLDSKLFRPPYGRIKISQIKELESNYKIIMWDVISGDFDLSINKEQVLDNVMSNAKGGSIIVMHDSVKAEEKIRYSLPKVLDHFKAEGYSFKKIETAAIANA